MALYPRCTICSWFLENWYKRTFQIARHVPMFPLEREGIQQAVNVLRGQQYMIGETPMISTMAIDPAQRRVQVFQQRCGTYGEAALHLAYHAALPVALNAELLHLLRINFFLDPPEILPYTAEFEFLLSPLCREIDEGLYEIEPEIRDVLLAGLTQTYDTQRAHAIATLLWQYVDRHSPWSDRVELERAQQLTALNFLNPEKAQQWLVAVETEVSQGQVAAREWFVAMRKDIENQAQLHQESTKAIPKEIMVKRLQRLMEIIFARKPVSEKAHLQVLLARVQEAKTDDFFELAKIASLNPTKDFRGQNLSGLDLHSAQLAGADLLGVDLHQTILVEANLTEANLRGADLRNCILVRAQVLQTDFSGANLTGICLQDWNLNSRTNFTDVRCDYVFRQYENEQPTDRYPLDRNFEFGEFAAHFQLAGNEVAKPLVEQSERAAESLRPLEQQVHVFSLRSLSTPQVQTFQTEVVRIGRAQDNDLALPEMEGGISRQHAEIFRRYSADNTAEPTYFLRDFSRFGTWVLAPETEEWQKIQHQEVVLLSGTQLKFGSRKNLVLEFLIKEPEVSESKSGLALEVMLGSIMEKAKKLTDADRSALWLVDRDLNQLWMKIPINGTFQELRIPMGAGFAGQVAVTGEPISIPFDLSNDPNTQTSKETDNKTKYRTCSILCMPVFNANSELIGVTQLINKKKRHCIMAV